MTAVVGFCCFFALMSIKLIKRLCKTRWPSVTFVPEMLIVVTVVIVLVVSFGLGANGELDLLGQFGEGFKAPRVPNFTLVTGDAIGDMATTVVLIAIIGYVESIAGAKVFASRHRYNVSPNRELVAYGMSNIVGSLFGGYPAFGRYFVFEL